MSPPLLCIRALNLASSDAVRVKFLSPFSKADGGSRSSLSPWDPRRPDGRDAAAFLWMGGDPGGVAGNRDDPHEREGAADEAAPTADGAEPGATAHAGTSMLNSTDHVLPPFIEHSLKVDVVPASPLVRSWTSHRAIPATIFPSMLTSSSPMDTWQ
jgi:hypothetical protein